MKAGEKEAIYRPASYGEYEKRRYRENSSRQLGQTRETENVHNLYLTQDMRTAQ
jgi:hypothetical protein